MWILRIILILAGIACLIALYLYMRKHPPRHRQDDHAEPRVEPEWRMPSDARHLPEADVPVPSIQFESGADAANEPVAEQPRTAARQDAIFMLAVKLPDAGVAATKVLQAIKRLGCTPNREGIYRALNEHDKTLYNIANLFEPGVLDPPPEADRLQGLALFFAKTPGRDEADTFGHMLGAARDLARTLGGEVQDASHRPLTAARELELKLAASH